MCVETAVAVQSRVVRATRARSLTNSCDFLPVITGDASPANRRAYHFFFFFFYRRLASRGLHEPLASSRGDKYLTSRFASSQLAAIARNRDGGRRGFIALNNRGDRHCCVRRFEGGAVRAPRAIGRTRIFESIGSTFLCRRLEAHYIRLAGFISAPDTVHWFNPRFYIELRTTVRGYIAPRTMGEEKSDFTNVRYSPSIWITWPKRINLATNRE